MLQIFQKRKENHRSWKPSPCSTSPVARMPVTTRASASICRPPGTVHPSDTSSSAIPSRQHKTQDNPVTRSANGIWEGQQEGMFAAHDAETGMQQHVHVQGQQQASVCKLQGGTLSSAISITPGRLRAAGCPEGQALSMDPADRQPPIGGKRTVPLIPVLQPANPNHASFVARHLPALQISRPHTAPSSNGMTISTSKTGCVDNARDCQSSRYNCIYIQPWRV